MVDPNQTDLDSLKIVLWSRFGALNNEFADPDSIKLSAEMT